MLSCMAYCGPVRRLYTPAAAFFPSIRFFREVPLNLYYCVQVFDLVTQRACCTFGSGACTPRIMIVQSFCRQPPIIEQLCMETTGKHSCVCHYSLIFTQSCGAVPSFDQWSSVHIRCGLQVQAHDFSLYCTSSTIVCRTQPLYNAIRFYHLRSHKLIRSL